MISHNCVQLSILTMFKGETFQIEMSAEADTLSVCSILEYLKSVEFPGKFSLEFFEKVNNNKTPRFF